MKFPLSWISEYVKLEVSPEKLATDLQFSGTKVESIKKVEDEVIFDFEITPNRADCYGVIGIAREIAAIYGKELILPPVFSETQVSSNTKEIDLKISETKLCPAYSLGIVESVKVDPSPNWIVKRLEKSGLRSLNNVVDITNYVMLETGQPMHAFDLDKISGNMNLRSSHEGETLQTIDGKERKLPKGSIIIEDNEKIIDLAGLMGGKTSQVDENTKNLILHVPIYDPVTIRKTSQFLGLRTEASGRFEKKLDPAGHRFAFERAAKLLKNLADAKSILKIKSAGYPPKRRKVDLPVSLINRILGLDLKISEIKEILERLGFSLKLSDDKKIFEVEIPTFRTDINEPIDFTEEIGRIYGYNKFPKTLQVYKLPGRHGLDLDFEIKIKQILSGIGLSEVIGNPLTSYSTLENLGLRSEKYLKVSNRIVSDYEYLRPTLFTSLLEAVSRNSKNFNHYRLFEVGRVFEPKIDAFGLPNQPKKVAVAVVGYDFGHTKGILEALLRKLNIEGLNYLKTKSEIFDFLAIDLFIGKEFLGSAGVFSNQKLPFLEQIDQVSGFELKIELLQKLEKPKKFKPLPKYPTVKENISAFVPDNVSFNQIEASIKKGAGSNLLNLEVLEDTIIDKKRSILLSVEYFDKLETLSKERIEKIRNGVEEELAKIGVQIR